MAHVVSRTGVWDVDDSEVTLPTLELSGIDSGKMIKLTCQFFARTRTDNLNDGFEYTIQVSGATIPLTPGIGLVQGSDSWQLFTHIALFQAQSTDKIIFNLVTDKSDMNGKGSMMNLLILAEIMD
jgi:hypothetical protein